MLLWAVSRASEELASAQLVSALRISSTSGKGSSLKLLCRLKCHGANNSNKKSEPELITLWIRFCFLPGKSRLPPFISARTGSDEAVTQNLPDDSALWGLYKWKTPGQIRLWHNSERSGIYPVISCLLFKGRVSLLTFRWCGKRRFLL